MKEIFRKLFDYFFNFYTFLYFSFFLTDYSFILKKRISNISGFTAFFIILLILRWFWDKRTLGQLFLFRLLRRISRINDKLILFIIFILISCVLTTLGIARHLSLSSTWDMTIYEQPLWNTLHGNLLFSSLKGNNNILGDHFVPILLFAVPFYALFPHVSTVIVIQALALAAALIPLYWIAKEKLTNRALIFSFLISFLLSKAVRGIGLSDFHPDSFMVTPALLAFYFLIKKKNTLLLISVFVILLCKETASFIVLGLGIYSLFPLKRFKLGVGLVLTAILVWLLETKVIIPNINNFGVYTYMLRMPFGNTYQENIQFVINYPLGFLKFIFMPAKILYLIKLLGPLGFLSFFAPSQLVLIFVPLSLILLASTQLSGYYLISSHYVTLVLPFVYISSIYGVHNLINFLKKKESILSKFFSLDIQKSLAILIIVFSLSFHGKTDVYKFIKFIDGMKRNNSFYKLRHLTLIPKYATVSATANLTPHLSHRKYIFTWFPDAEISLSTEYLVIDLAMIEYLNQNQKDKIPQFLEESSKNGLIKIFAGEDGNFLIFKNSRSDKSVIENFRGDAGPTIF